MPNVSEDAIELMNRNLNSNDPSEEGARFVESRLRSNDLENDNKMLRLIKIAQRFLLLDVEVTFEWAISIIRIQGTSSGCETAPASLI